MASNSIQEITQEIEKLELLKHAKILQAYLECSSEIQEGIREMLEIINDPNVDSDDRAMALNTLADALFPHPHNGKLGMDLEESEREGAAYSDEMREAVEAMNEEEATFADRLQKIMQERNLTQTALAQLVGLQQPAISNMLRRQCRPQRQTVLRFAEALGVDPDELWPGFTP
jgi:lambda repressor-like predicted transcriptional regulator